MHGGTRFSGPVRIDAGVVRRLEALTDLAPLHQPKSLAALAAVTAVLPDVPAVACFDTAFHATLPARGVHLRAPARVAQALGAAPVRVPRALARVRLAAGGGAARPARRTGLRIVTCHLGAGASLAAVLDGRSVDTTMGFTPLDGLVMATRSGSVDPGLVLWLAEHVGMPPAELAATLEHRSGLLGLAGTADMREILAGAAAGDPRRGSRWTSTCTGSGARSPRWRPRSGGLDVLVFTGGVGERAPVVRALAADGLGFLGVALDPARNETGPEDREIGADGAPVRTLVVAAREDVEIAREVRRVLTGSASRQGPRRQRAAPNGPFGR